VFILVVDLVTVGKFCVHFSCGLGSIVDCVNVNSNTSVVVNYAL